MQIKVGQIYGNENYRICITKTLIACDINTNIYIKGINYIFYDGAVGFMTNMEKFTIGLSELKLLAEYPTWQEAVASKEFKGE